MGLIITWNTQPGAISILLRAIQPQWSAVLKLAVIMLSTSHNTLTKKASNVIVSRLFASLVVIKKIIDPRAVSRLSFGMKENQVMLKTLNTSKPIPNHARTVTHKLKRTRVVSTSCVQLVRKSSVGFALKKQWATGTQKMKLETTWNVKEWLRLKKKMNWIEIKLKVT